MTPPVPPSAESISVVIPVFNQPAYVIEAIRSVLAQGNLVSEVIVVDDSSTDGTPEAVRGIGDPLVQLHTQPHGGPSAARNTGWRNSRSEWIQFLDADDRLPPQALANLFAAAKGAPGHIPFGIQGVYPERMEGAPASTSQLADHSGWLVEELAVWYHGSILTALLPRPALEAVGGFDDQVRFGEDYDLAIRLALHYPFVFVPAITYEARMHGMNRHAGFGLKAEEAYLDTVRRCLGGREGATARRQYRQAMANWLWQFGDKAWQRGDATLARRRFREAGQFQPLKVRAWLAWATLALHPGARHPSHPSTLHADR